MHLHILSPMLRRKGVGAEFVKSSTQVYFRVLELERLFCEPNAFNVAPNRTLQRAGFHYLFTLGTAEADQLPANDGPVGVGSTRVHPTNAR